MDVSMRREGVGSEYEEGWVFTIGLWETMDHSWILLPEFVFVIMIYSSHSFLLSIAWFNVWWKSPCQQSGHRIPKGQWWAKIRIALKTHIDYNRC